MVKVLGYTPEIGEFLSDAINNRRSPQSFDNTGERTHHEQHIIPRNAVAVAQRQYDGPFAAKFGMTDEGYPVVKVNPGMILAGTEVVEFAEETIYLEGENIRPDYSFAVYATLVYNENGYETGTLLHKIKEEEGEGGEAEEEEEPPAPTAEMCVWRIAAYDKDTRKLTQTQYGDIQVAGRCVQ